LTDRSSNNGQCIAALASAPGSAAIAVVRISGEGCFDLANSCIKLKGKSQRIDRQMHLCNFLDPTSSQVIDEPLVVWMPGPNSFTGEDSIEIFCHGSPYIVQRTLRALYSTGIRQANPGEYTQRAFLNGKLDLTEAEGIKELVEAQSHQQWVAARQLATGTLKNEIEVLRHSLIEAMAYLEAQIDFPDEGDTASANLAGAQQRVSVVKDNLTKLLSSFEDGQVASQGLQVVLIGEPNSGKSTLMNTLLGRERAIVTDIPGTTRDYLEEKCLIDGRLIRLVDAAGIRESSEKVEAIGINKAIALAKEADVVCYLAPSDSEDALRTVEQWIAEQRPENHFKVRTKADLIQDTLESKDWLSISCKTGIGIDLIKKKFAELVDQHMGNLREGAFITSPRHAEALGEALSSIAQFESLQSENGGEELLAFELQAAHKALQSIVGVIDSEDILDKIFSTFCVGK
jgi:tRNA modification GTPase